MAFLGNCIVVYLAVTTKWRLEFFSKNHVRFVVCDFFQVGVLFNQRHDQICLFIQLCIFNNDSWWGPMYNKSVMICLKINLIWFEKTIISDLQRGATWHNVQWRGQLVIKDVKQIMAKLEINPTNDLQCQVWHDTTYNERCEWQ